MDLAQYAQRTFGMFGGEPQELVLRFAARLAGVVLDRFGKETIFLPENENAFRVHVQTVVSPQFMGWLAGFGSEAKLLGPPKVREEYLTFCRAMLAQYDEPDAGGEIPAGVENPAGEENPVGAEFPSSGENPAGAEFPRGTE